jgi:hypothetical protein
MAWKRLPPLPCDIISACRKSIGIGDRWWIKENDKRRQRALPLPRFPVNTAGLTTTKARETTQTG